MFCDPPGFTHLSEAVSTEELIRGMNCYLTAVTEAVLENEGTIAQYIGDAVFAYWLAEEHSDHSARACRFVQTLRHRLAGSSYSSPYKLIPHIGIHTGRVAMISIDRKTRRDLTPIGDTVNLASRLSSLCTQLKAEAIITDAVHTRVGAIPGSETLGEVNVKGKDLPVTLYRI